MLERPANLADAQLCDAVATQYGLTTVDITFLPIGHDPAAWVYRLLATDGEYFVKVRLRLANVAGLIVPRFLADAGIDRVVAPLPALDGRPWATAAGYAVILYPFLHAETGMQRGLTDRQWRDIGVLLRRIHDVTWSPAVDAVLTREPYVPAGVSQIRSLQARLVLDRRNDETTRAFAVAWAARRTVIDVVVGRAETLAASVARLALPLVLCHTDIHTANVLVDAAGDIWIVDWDEVMLAPRERDLMFVIGGIHRRLVSPRDEASFFDGYSATTVEPAALAYYRYAWATADIGAYGDQAVARPDLGPRDRQDAVVQFQRLFEPDAIVDLAMTSPLPGIS